MRSSDVSSASKSSGVAPEGASPSASSRLHQMRKLAQPHRARHARAAFERVQCAAQLAHRLAVVRIAPPSAQFLAGLREQFRCFVQEDRQHLRVDVVVNRRQRILQRQRQLDHRPRQAPPSSATAPCMRQRRGSAAACASGCVPGETADNAGRVEGDFVAVLGGGGGSRGSFRVLRVTRRFLPQLVQVRLDQARFRWSAAEKARAPRPAATNWVSPATARASTGCALLGSGAPRSANASSVCSRDRAVAATIGKPPVRWMPHSVWPARIISAEGTVRGSNCSTESSFSSVARCWRASSQRILHSDVETRTLPIVISSGSCLAPATGVAGRLRCGSRSAR